MSETYLLALVLGSAAIVGSQVIIGLNSMFRARQLERELRSERTRAKFARARKRLLELVINGDIDPDSHTFRSIHFLSTFIMRRPGEYEKISNAMAVAMIAPADQASPLLQESKSWNSATHEVAADTAKAIDALILDHIFESQFVLRLLCKLIVQVAKVGVPADKMNRKFDDAIDHVAQKDESLATFRDGRKSMNDFLGDPVMPILAVA